MNANSASNKLETLDLAITDMDTQLLEERAASALRATRGVHNVTLIERGATVQYDPLLIKKEHILDRFQTAGFHPVIFQDSASGETREVEF
jgi:hypothetical protein